ncbi:putative mediator of RNA polymerase II transcription subunit 26 isoform X2 [Drosophila grimshawi]|uniref:putative mediator of RNA polymerase II transcription subunit 26 isoform X2 n=1 Tax=Drosophila grimshawi TaxID=7222 RepID=UPI000C86EACF|nr:putative mediator of RNA polymerase II transcription subunit 26 isoform X2 [Drosophila grimshawi]
MKADRLMRVNGRKNLWLLRNTNKIYDSAVKSYYDRKNSFLACNPIMQSLKVCEEHRAPLRKTLLEYPRNHKQVVEQVNNANSGNLLSTVIQANRRRSMSFSAGGLRMYRGSSREWGNFGSSLASSSTSLGAGNKQRRNMRTAAAEMDIDQLNLSVLHGRSMSLPARTTLELGMGNASDNNKVRKRDPQPSCRHHLNKIEQSRQRQHSRISDYDYADPQLMVVDEALKQCLAGRFDRQAEAGENFGKGRLIDSLQLKGLSQAAQKEQMRIHTLGDRIRRFEVIQFADGPVKFQAFNRRQEYGSGRIRHLDSKQIPKQPHCLSFHNVLHTNHRQRSMNYPIKQELKQKQEQVQKMVMGTKRRTQAVQLVSEKKKATPLEPLGPLGPRAPNRRPQQKQQQQEQLNPGYIDASPRPNKKLNKTKSKRSIRLAKTRSKILKQTGSQTNTKNKQMTQQQQQQHHLDKGKIKKMRNLISSRYCASGIQAAATTNKITRTSHVVHIRSSNAGRRLELAPQRLAEQLQAQREKKMPQKMTIKLPEQPESLKGINHLVAASASQVTDCKRAVKKQQQIMRAEMLHMHAQQLRQREQQKQQQPQQIHQLHRELVNRQQQHPQKLLSKPTGCLPKAVKTHAISQPMSKLKPPAKMKPKTKQPRQQQPKQQYQKQQHQKQLKLPQTKKRATQQWEGKKSTGNRQSAAIPLPVEPSQKRRPQNLPIHEPAGGHKNATEKYLSTSYQRMQQQQLHQQLRQRRQQPYENIWRHTY